MGLLNPLLHDPGPTPGSAASWTLTSHAQAQRFGAFGPSPVRAAEDFERWSDLATTFSSGALVLAFFDGAAEGYESFEDGWTASTFVSTFSEAMLDAYPFADGAEDMETGWLTAPFVTTWGGVVQDVGVFGGAPHEDFGAWSAAGPVTWVAAAFDAGTASAEAFAGAWPVMKTL